MTLRGSAFLCLWNDFAPDRYGEYEDWHTLEHVPERVAAPGFLAGRRYGAPARDDSRYMTLYDLDRLEALDTPQYLDLQQNPTDWSARMRPDFRNVLRIPFERIASEGAGCAGNLAIFAVETADMSDDAPRRVAEAVARRHAEGGMSAYHVGRALKVPEYGVFGLAAETRPDRQKIVVLQETPTPEGAERALQWCRAALPDHITPDRVLRAETSRLLFAVGHEEVVTKWQRRAAPETAGLRSRG
ncbi:hypothetical protein [Salipiger sp.]|uniref:hypothetical protein n=1 Tax=Salipiger sp. TaxID=2078585 RepID=UPI003A96FEBD